MKSGKVTTNWRIVIKNNNNNAIVEPLLLLLQTPNLFVIGNRCNKRMAGDGWIDESIE